MQLGKPFAGAFSAFLPALVLVIGLTDPATATIIPREEAVETYSLQLTLRQDLTGTVSGRSCERCELKRFPVTPDTQAFEGATPVDLREALRQRGKPATIIYDIRSREATRIVW